MYKRQGKTTLTESLLYASGTISEPGSVEKGTTLSLIHISHWIAGKECFFTAYK